jgi:hypothetical protein
MVLRCNTQKTLMEGGMRHYAGPVICTIIKHKLKLFNLLINLSTDRLINLFIYYLIEKLMDLLIRFLD